MSRYIFITGVSTGIGRAVCEQIAEEGFQVIGTVRNELDKERLESELPSNCTILICDITVADQLKDCISKLEIILDGNPLYALINNSQYFTKNDLCALPGMYKP